MNASAATEADGSPTDAPLLAPLLAKEAYAVPSLLSVTSLTESMTWAVGEDA